MPFRGDQDILALYPLAFGEQNILWVFDCLRTPSSIV
jgi:hypothetical protein